MITWFLVNAYCLYVFSWLLAHDHMPESSAWR